MALGLWVFKVTVSQELSAWLGVGGWRHLRTEPEASTVFYNKVFSSCGNSALHLSYQVVLSVPVAV